MPSQSLKSQASGPSGAKRLHGKSSGGTKTPKRPLSVEERLKRLFTSLCAQIDGGYYNNAIKMCDKILRLEPNDADALQTKLFLLLQTENYDAALSLISEDNDQDHHAFEKSYSLYRLQRESDARDILRSIKEQKGEDRGVVHLEAQLSYREGLYQNAFDLYNDLLDTAEPNTEEHSDILTNLQAAQRHLDFINQGFLRALDALPTSVTNPIEFAAPPSQPISAMAATLASTVPATALADAAPKAPKKTRMTRVPAGVTPGVTPPPDPERWLKKSERSTFNQGKRRKGAGGGGGATQGSASVETAPSAAPGGSTSSHAAKNAGGKGKKKK